MMATYHIESDNFWHKLDEFVINVKEHYSYENWSSCYIEVHDGSKLYFDLCCYLLSQRDILQSMIDSKDNQLSLLESMI